MHITALVKKKHASASVVNALLFSKSGFTDELIREAAASSNGRIQLVDLQRLYTSD